MREITTVLLDQSGLLRQRLRLRFRAGGTVRGATGVAIQWCARTVELVVVSCGWVLVPILPLAAALIARDVQFARRYSSTLAQLTRHIRATWRGRAVSRVIERRLTPAWMRQPQGIAGTCTHCGNCCLYRSCVFLQFDEEGRSRCRIYGGRVWNYLSCGEYPIDGDDIERYSCPSFHTVEHPVAGRHRVIPLVSAGGPPRGHA